jgi:hypothetical protein
MNIPVTKKTQIVVGERTNARRDEATEAESVPAAATCVARTEVVCTLLGMMIPQTLIAYPYRSRRNKVESGSSEVS